MPSALLGFARDTLPTALWLILAAALLMFFWARYHWSGALKEPGPDRDDLIQALCLGGHLRLLYIHWITKALNRADRILRDHDKAALSLRLPFGRWPERPYWTGWSFDVSALIAVVYPVLWRKRKTGTIEHPSGMSTLSAWHSHSLSTVSWKNVPRCPA